MRRPLLVLLALLAAASVFATASPAQVEQGAGTPIGGPVSSTLSLDLAQAGATVRAVVTTTEPGSRLSVAPAAGRSGLSAKVSGPYAPLDPWFGLPLVAWDDVLAGQATTIRLKSASASTSTVFITLGAQTP
jgi:hypothetical protein